LWRNLDKEKSGRVVCMSECYYHQYFTNTFTMIWRLFLIIIFNKDIQENEQKKNVNARSDLKYK